MKVIILHSLWSNQTVVYQVQHTNIFIATLSTFELEGMTINSESYFYSKNQNVFKFVSNTFNSSSSGHIISKKSISQHSSIIVPLVKQPSETYTELQGMAVYFGFKPYNII